jgi:ElaB/YqjD/DUF883 family membrane-anchored ribosome-binding protein
MRENALRKAIDNGTHIAVSAGDQIADAGRRVIQTTTAFSDAVEDGAAKLRRGVRKSLDAADSLKNETAKTIKRHPFRSLGIVTGISVGSGVIAGWLLRRRR